MNPPNPSDPAPPSARQSEDGKEGWLVPWVCLGLALATWLVFGQTVHHEFVNYDDDRYIYDTGRLARSAFIIYKL